MKRKSILFFPILFSYLFLCSACGKQDEISSCITKSLCAALPATVQAGKVSDVINILHTQDIINTQESLKIESTSRNAPVSLTFYNKKRSVSAADDRILYMSTCIYPVVAIEGNEKASDKINADIQSKVDSFHADTSSLEYAKYEYENYYDPDNFHFYAYTDGLTFTVARADSNVISFLVQSQSYAGGAHDMYSYSGLNYDAQTGEVIDFSELSENEAAFYENTLAFHRQLAASNTYQSILFPADFNDSYNNSNDLGKILYQENRWYLSTSGLVFFSNPYELGPFSSGNIDFTIPYADLNEMGFLEKYDYKGRKTIRLQTEEVCAFDLNGDGQEENIQFYIEKPGSINTAVHFMINGMDYASENEKLCEQFSDNNYIFCWTECFLYDMNPEDDMTEIAFQMNYEHWEEDIIAPYTFLYRYEKDSSLTYLGRIKGAITDPTVVFSFES